jgi:transmembrane sensor
MSDRFKHLPDPVGDALADAPDDLRIERAYRRLRQPRSGRAIPMRAVLAAAVAIAIALLAFFAGRFTAPSNEESGAAVVPAALRTTSGGPLGRIESRRVALEDGSSIEVASGALVETERNDGEAVRLVLVRGRTTIEVEPGGPRTWTIDCGLATVSVVGTRFTLERADETLRVSVDHGVVSVRGERVPDGVRFVRAGETLVVGEEPRVAVVEPPVEPEPPVEREVAPVEREAAAPSAPDWRELAEEGAWNEAYEALGPSGVGRRVERATAEELLLLADVARRSGHAAEAIAPLERLIANHRGADAALGAFTLGRLYADQLGDPARAATAFERALSDTLPAPLVPDALARLASARASAGHPGAAATASRYLTEYPDGPQRAAMEAIVSGRPR